MGGREATYLGGMYPSYHPVYMPPYHPERLPRVLLPSREVNPGVHSIPKGIPGCVYSSERYTRVGISLTVSVNPGVHLSPSVLTRVYIPTTVVYPGVHTYHRCIPGCVSLTVVNPRVCISHRC